MKSSRKIIILLPPLLIGMTVLLIAFSYQHSKNISAGSNMYSDTISTTSPDVFVTVPLPEPNQQTDETTGVEPPLIFCTADAKQCPDGSYVGRTGPNCEFSECVSELETKFCSNDSRLAEICAEIYSPVCAAVQVECITTPCNPVPETYSNVCSACMNERVISYTEGVCSVE